MRALSLFDGISCAMVAMERAGIKVDQYYASEIDKYAIKVSQSNYPDIIQLGDINNRREWDLGEIDIIFAGSPCQGFSFAGKGLNFDDPRSALFFTMVDIINHYKPKYFLVENVKMKLKHQHVFTQALGVIPVEINSSLVSAQNRKRMYWSNINIASMPRDREIKLIDVLDQRDGGDNVPVELDYSKGVGCARQVGRRLNEFGTRKDYDKSIPLKQYIELNLNQDKANTITTATKDNILLMGEYKSPVRRHLSVTECERLQTLPVGYTAGVSDTQRRRQLANGRTVDVISHILSFISLS